MTTQAPGRHYHGAEWVRAAAQALGYRPGTIHQWVYGPDGPMARVVALWPHLPTEIRSRWRASLLALPCGCTLTADLHQDVAEAEARYDTAEIAYLLNSNATTWDTLRRALEAYRAILDRLICAGDNQWRPA